MTSTNTGPVGDGWVHTCSRRALSLCLAALCTPGAVAAPAQTYPARPVRIIAPFPPAGSSDLLARAIAQELSSTWSQPVVVENIAGAAGAIGAERAAHAAPDGYSLLMGHLGTLAVNPALYPKLGYDPVRSFVPVAWVARVPNVLVVNPAVLAVHTLGEFVAAARARPGKINYGSGGNGSAAHITMEYLKLRCGIALLHIPYRGAGPALQDLLAGENVFTVQPGVAQMPIRDGMQGAVRSP